MALRVGQVGAQESHVDARARDAEAHISDEKRFFGRMLPARRFRQSRWRCGVLALALVGAWLAPAAAPPPALAASLVHVFHFTGTMQNWTVPAGVHRAHFDVRGAQGGGIGGDPAVPGGEGGRTVAEVRVFPGEVIHIFVGGRGSDGGNCPAGTPHPVRSLGGYNGGGNGGSCVPGRVGGGGGGGASDIRVDGTELSNRYIVAGGGGGASDFADKECGLSAGGGGGGLHGVHGVAAVTRVEGGVVVPVCVGATGGSQTSGGAQLHYPDGRGSLGLGGTGEGRNGYSGGGGGGGGYYGGGGGFLASGGGGGSGLEPRVDSPPFPQSYTGVHKGNGEVILSFTQPD